jgi:hypothetical protein
MASNAEFSPGVDLAATARVHSQAPGVRIDAATLEAIGLICGTGPIVALLLSANGLDLSISFFLNAFDSLRPRSRASGPRTKH